MLSKHADQPDFSTRLQADIFFQVAFHNPPLKYFQVGWLELNFNPTHTARTQKKIKLGPASSLLVVIMSNDNKLLMGVHSKSLSGAVKTDKKVVDVFLECAKMKECLVLATPTADASVLSMLNPEIVRVSYENRGNGTLIATYGRARTVFYDIPPGMITSLYGFKEDSTNFEETKDAFRDLSAFEAISRWHKDESIFVTQNSNLLEKNVWVQKRFDTKILSLAQALEYFDLYLKKRDLYYLNPYLGEVDGKAFHYWFLLKDLVPKFAEAWSISVFGQDVIQNGQNIRDVLTGLADKFENALYSSDRIAMEYTKRPANSTKWEMLYNFNYFCLLVTGIFDLLAWLTVHRYSIQIRRREQVSIRITSSGSKGAKFVAVISKHNSPLASLIEAKKDFINLFYPLRNAIAHREPVRGPQFEDRSEGWIASLADIKQDALAAIQRIDQPRHQFTKWGLLNIPGIGDLLEPHRFTREALRNLMDFANAYIELLDLPSLIASHQNLIDKIADARSKETESTTFIAKTYWRRDSHLPILFRNR